MKTPNSAMCPSCERFIGPADVCPYCDADSAKPLMIRRLRYAALALALIGLAFLYLAARRRETPLIRIGDITPMMSFAGVRVAGTVGNAAYVKRTGNAVEYLAFHINDGTGDLQVGASGDMARRLVEENRVPGKGDGVELTGTLSVSGDGKIRLRPSQVNVTRRGSPHDD